ncbi:hypothetical protein Patl1_19188 [Pistacia atlantica]|uniref:Uncharacterized protein n=1 Tax=Pistacia atlantica TaxID=434234 RepID=A0ACC1C318_9ROSI|nr:hypothetical protein Patl1_19188 [Pistacia atlantica]
MFHRSRVHTYCCINASSGGQKSQNKPNRFTPTRKIKFNLKWWFFNQISVRVPSFASFRYVPTRISLGHRFDFSTWRASYGGGRGMQAAKRNDNAVKLEKMKPKICTADELHYVPVSNSDWRLALWRYLPSPKSLRRNHPLLLLSGVGTNAIGYDLSPQSSFARFMSGQGFDTWILEVRGAGLSTHGEDFREVTETLDGPQSVTPQLFELHERLSTSIGGFQRQLDLIMKNDWDFDHYLEEDVPAVVR